MNRIFINYSELPNEIAKYRTAADNIEAVEYSFTLSETDMPSMVLYMEMMENLDCFIKELSCFLHKDMDTLEWMSREWNRVDREISQSF